MWEHFSHQADIGIKAEADSLPGAFEDAASALTAIITEKEIEPTEVVQVECSAENNEILLIDWLNAIIYEMAVRKMLFSKFEVEINSLKLSAKIWGEKIDYEKHAPAVEPKAMTYNQLSVKEENGKWTVRCVVDV
ncbi:MAG: archease [Sedimentisphaerales bacterium]|nr:archease [Sedimentisphaerales bacterium]